MAYPDRNETLRKGILAARRGHTEPARRLLSEVTAADSGNELAWLWLARVTDGAVREEALQKALALNPDNRWAAEQLAGAGPAAPSGTVDAPPPPPGRKAEVVELKCPSCAGTVAIHGERGVQTAVCNYCGSVLDLTAEQTSILAQVDLDVQPLQPIHPGDRGTFDEVEYEVYGWMRYEGSDDEETWIWDEWLLVAADGDARWLSYDDEVGFVLQRRITDYEPFDPRRAMVIKTPRGGAFVKERDTARLVALRGELTWQANVGDPIRYLEAQGRKNEKISVEITDTELEVHAGFPLTAYTVWQAFGNEEKIAATEARHRRAQERAAERAARVEKLRPRRRVAGWLFLLSLLGALYAGCSGSTVLNETVTLSPTDTTRILGPVEITNTRQALELDLKSDPLPTNSWVTVSAWAYDAKQAKYHLETVTFWDEEGYDSDGRWHESKRNAEVFFRAVTPGAYRLELNYLDASANASSALGVRAELEEGQWRMWPFVLATIFFGLAWFGYKVRGA